MTSSARSAAPRWVLLAALVFGLLSMHSMVAHDPMHAHHESVTRTGVSAQATPVADSACCDDHGSSPGHDMMHLCLAVLAAVAGLVVGWLLWRRGRPNAGHQGQRSTVTRLGRDPPRPRVVGDVLASLCVLRL